MTEEKKTETLDLWVAGTEEPDFQPTSEGAQQIGDHESQDRLDRQFGRVIDDDYVFDDEVGDDERTIINMGPQHPSTHGVLRLQLELEGEIVRRTKPIIGYLHTGMEKTAEQLTFSQGPTNVTRMDYLAPFHNELAFSLAVEKLLDVEVPPRAAAIRVLMTELNRITSHLVALATNGMDLGALSMMIYGFRERELILSFFEKTTGLRMNHNYIRPGGVAADLPPGWKDDVAGILEEIPGRLEQYDDLLKDNPIWVTRTKGVGVITKEEALRRATNADEFRLRLQGIQTSTDAARKPLRIFETFISISPVRPAIAASARPGSR